MPIPPQTHHHRHRPLVIGVGTKKQAVVVLPEAVGDDGDDDDEEGQAEWLLADIQSDIAYRIDRMRGGGMVQSCAKIGRGRYEARQYVELKCFILEHEPVPASIQLQLRQVIAEPALVDRICRVIPEELEDLLRALVGISGGDGQQPRPAVQGIIEVFTVGRKLYVIQPWMARPSFWSRPSTEAGAKLFLLEMLSIIEQLSERAEGRTRAGFENVHLSVESIRTDESGNRFYLDILPLPQEWPLSPSLQARQRQQQQQEENSGTNNSTTAGDGHAPAVAAVVMMSKAFRRCAAPPGLGLSNPDRLVWSVMTILFQCLTGECVYEFPMSFDIGFALLVQGGGFHGDAFANAVKFHGRYPVIKAVAKLSPALRALFAHTLTLDDSMRWNLQEIQHYIMHYL